MRMHQPQVANKYHYIDNNQHINNIEEKDQGEKRSPAFHKNLEIFEQARAKRFNLCSYSMLHTGNSADRADGNAFFI